MSTDAVVIYTEAAVAELFEMDEVQVAKLRRKNGWPHLKVGRQVRYTQAHVEQIIAAHTQAPVEGDVPVEADLGSPVSSITGLTSRSAGRRRTG